MGIVLCCNEIIRCKCMGASVWARGKQFFSHWGLKIGQRRIVLCCNEIIRCKCMGASVWVQVYGCKCMGASVWVQVYGGAESMKESMNFIRDSCKSYQQ